MGKCIIICSVGYIVLGWILEKPEPEGGPMGPHFFAIKPASRRAYFERQVQ